MSFGLIVRNSLGRSLTDSLPELVRGLFRRRASADRARLDLLLVNPYDPALNWAEIPMGLFGICDFLSQHGLSARILNLAQHIRGASGRPLASQMAAEHFVRATEAGEDIARYIGIGHVLHVLDDAVAEYRPRLIGVALHWLQLIDESLRIATHLKNQHPDIPIVVGGLAASFFGERVLAECPQIDYVVQGDAFEPLRALLHKEPDVPNLFRRCPEGVARPPRTWAASAEELSSFSFTKLDYLLDYEGYLQSKRPALAVLLKRGCNRDCSFCGGNRDFYRKYFHECGVAHRSIESVVRDLRLLLGYGWKRVYFYAETHYLKRLLNAMAQDGLAKTFFISLVVDLDFDDELFELYQRVSRFDRDVEIEISPENLVDGIYLKNSMDRAEISEFWDRIERVSRILGDHQYELNVFFSRYHDTHESLSQLEAYLHHLEWLSHERITDPRICICFFRLSTDPGSRYWEESQARGQSLAEIAHTYRYIELTRAGNWTMYHPQSLDPRALGQFEQMVLEAMGPR